MTMKIESSDQSAMVKQLGSTRSGGTEEVRASQAESEKSRQRNGETVQLSERGKLMAVAKAELEKIPDVDQKKVDAIKDQIANGTYQTNSKGIANRIIQEAMFTSIV